MSLGLARGPARTTRRTPGSALLTRHRVKIQPNIAPLATPSTPNPTQAYRTEPRLTAPVSYASDLRQANQTG